MVYINPPMCDLMPSDDSGAVCGGGKNPSLLLQACIGPFLSLFPDTHLYRALSAQSSSDSGGPSLTHALSPGHSTLRNNYFLN